MMHPYFKDMMSFEQVYKLPDLINFESIKTPYNKKKISLLEEMHLQYEKQYMKQAENASETADSFYNANDL